MDETCLKTVEKSLFVTFEMLIIQHIAECCKVPFISRGPTYNVQFFDPLQGFKLKQIALQIYLETL